MFKTDIESVVDNALFHQKNKLMDLLNQFTIEQKNIPFILDNIRQVLEFLEFNAELWRALSYDYKTKEILAYAHDILRKLRDNCHPRQIRNIDEVTSNLTKQLLF
jgi:uncharacterized protein YfkK (UPF0435 family)